jgi:formate dehydrogenase subunit delta
MDIQHLIKMANQIGAYFQAEPDRAAALDGIAGHIKRFWDPRMRRQIVEWVERHGAEGLSELAAEAIRTARDRLV